MDQNQVLGEVIRYMVNNSVNGLFHGTPRDRMEDLAVSSGPLYHALYNLGITRFGRGRNATWTIPQNIIDNYRE
jgi:hypothetical protein